MSQTVIGFFDDQQEAQRAVEKLQSTGISRDRIDVRRGGGGAGISTSGIGSTNPVSGSERDENSVSRTSEGRTVDVGGRNTNAFTDFFNNLFGGSDNNDDADRYSRVAQGSNAIITVHAQSREEAERAADILDDCGAVDVDERAAQYSRAAASRTGELADRSETTISRVEENLNVGKQIEEKGGIRVRSRIVERPIEEHVRLREEHVNVERQPVDRPVSLEDARSFQESEIELTETTEVPVVSKEARVVEEIRISKDVTERDEIIHDTVRHTEIDVDRIDEGTARRGGISSGTDSDDLTSSGRSL